MRIIKKNLNNLKELDLVRIFQFINKFFNCKSQFQEDDFSVRAIKTFLFELIKEVDKNQIL